MNMFPVMLVKLGPQEPIVSRDLASGPTQFAWYVLCSENYRVEDHKCIVCVRVHTIVVVMMRVAQIQRVIGVHLC